MIREFLASFLTPAPKWAKGMNFHHEAIAIEARARRCREAWAPHHQFTKDAILDSIKACKQHRTVLVVGSGTCLDIPLAELATIFEHVRLIDIIHPWKSKRHNWSHVVHVPQDITGQMETLYHNPEQLPEMYVPEAYHHVPDIDLALSVNLASQLPIVPLKYLERTTFHDERDLEKFAKNLLVAHFTWLSNFTCMSALICDMTWETLDLNGKLIEVHDPLYGLISQQTTRKWHWDVEPRQETGSEVSRRNCVGYWSNFRFGTSEDLAHRSK